METSSSEYEQIAKYEGFYIGRYEAGIATYDEETGSFENTVTFSNNASLEGAVDVQTGINNWWWQNYDYTARQEGTIVGTGTNKATGNIVSRANSIPYYHADYYTAVEMTRRMYENHKSVRSGLVTGTQWDMMMKYMQENGVDVQTSNWGNYDDVALSELQGYYTNVTYTNVISTHGKTDGFKSTNEITRTNAGLNTWVLLTTGATEQVKSQNLYDVAGNLWEWTMEASYAGNFDYNMSANFNTYILRGGSFIHSQASYPAVFRCCHSAPSTYTNFGFRTTLYIF